MASDKHYPYDIAISYAGEDRDIALTLAESLRTQGVSVFYDRYEKATLWGRNLYNYLSDLYQNQAHYCLMLLSQHYAQKVWTTHEREAAQNRAVHENEEYILPIRLDETDIPGHLKTLVYLNWHEETVQTITQAVLEKLGKPNEMHSSPPLSEQIISLPQAQSTLTPQKSKEEWLSEGEYFSTYKRYEEALAVYDQAIRLDPNDAFAYRSYRCKGNALYYLRRYEEALVACERSIQLNPKFGMAYATKGLVLQRMGRLNEAETAFSKARRLGFSE